MKVILPDYAIELLRQFTGDSDKIQWSIGDVSLALVDEFGDMYGKAPVREKIASETGLAPETVRDRENMARFFSEESRLEYDVLGYHQLRACKAAGKKWREYADWAIESADKYGGRPAPVAVIRAKIRGANDEEPGWYRKYTKVVDLVEAVIADESVPEPIRNMLSEFSVRLYDMGNEYSVR